MRRVTRALRRSWVWFCIAATTLLVGARAVHFSSVDLPASVDAFAGRLMEFELRVSLLRFVMTNFAVVSAAVIALLLLVRFRWCVRRYDAGPGLRPWLELLLWSGVLWASPILDAVPEVALLQAGTLALLVLALRGPGRAAQRTGAAALVGLPFVAYWFATSPSPAFVRAGLMWLVLGSFVAFFARRFVRLSDLVVVLLLVGGFCSALPLSAAQEPEGVRLGEGRAYAFCEVPGSGRLLATLNNCGDAVVDECREDAIVEYDPVDLSFLRRHEVFSDRFYGRMALLLCLEDAIVVGLSRTMIDGVRYHENVMQLDLDDPSAFVERLFDHRAADHVYDPVRDVAYFVTEYKNLVTRLDRRSGSLRQFRLGEPPDPNDRRLDGSIRDGSLKSNLGAISDRRNSLFFVEFLLGSTAYEVDRESLDVRAEYHPENGGSFSLVVDEGLGRLLLGGLWGVEVIDLETGRILHRRRTETGARLPVIDARRNLVYVPTMFGHCIRVYDRISFEPLGCITVDIGARNAYLSKDGRRLFATSNEAHFVWDAQRLADHFRR